MEIELFDDGQKASQAAANARALVATRASLHDEADDTWPLLSQIVTEIFAGLPVARQHQAVLAEVLERVGLQIAASTYLAHVALVFLSEETGIEQSELLARISQQADEAGETF